MNCGELRNLAPLYLSGELEGESRREFASHLLECAACAREIREQELLDARLAQALAQDLPDSTRVEQAILRQISSKRPAPRWMSAAGAMAAAVVLGGFLLFTHVPRAYADAVRDHQAEVVEKQPRHWRTNSAEIAALTSQVGLSFYQAASLAPAGYTLECAKFCGLDRRRTLHLVFTNGASKVSVYVSPHAASAAGVRMVTLGSERLAAFETGHFSALVVTAGASPECQEFAQWTATRL